MATSHRTQAMHNTGSRPGRNVDWPAVVTSSGSRPAFVSEIYGKNVLTLSAFAALLPKPMFKNFLGHIKGSEPISGAVADAVAHAARIWAMDRGATHYCHWFQPQTGTTASKHDTFLSLKAVDRGGGVMENVALDQFSGAALMQSEPDASSFPNGGMRTTFEARGYTVWDTASPMFLRPGAHGTSILYIPSVFITYNGDALDEKTILLRSNEALSKASVDLLNLCGQPEVTSVTNSLGCEQEFFLIDRAMYQMRPDLKLTGRTLVGNIPARHQQLEDHYFGPIPSRVTATLGELELELFKLGVPLKTRHNEVAPNQFEVAPIFEDSSIAVDHNLLTMEVLHTVAHRHGLKVLFHEKPFKGVNGSGKHGNWSMSTNLGENLLEPTLHPEENLNFLMFCSATLDAVHKHGGLLRCAIASSSNEHRLGAQEAPPGIISAFMGEQLTEVLNAIEEGRDVVESIRPQMKNIRVGGSIMDLQVSTLPLVARDLTDRNRTSPFAFTGNKFEFRAVGSKQSPSFPITLLNAVVADSLVAMKEALVKKMGSKSAPDRSDIIAVVREFVKSSKNVRFEGNGYSEEWVELAAKRGLLNIKSAPVAFKQILTKSSVDVLVKQKVLTEKEIHSRYHILCEQYTLNQVIEANAMIGICKQSILPASYAFRSELLDTVSKAVTTLGMKKESVPEYNVFNQIGTFAEKLEKSVVELSAITVEIEKCEDDAKKADIAGTKLIETLAAARKFADELEEIVADKHWPFPKYNELLL